MRTPAPWSAGVEFNPGKHSIPAVISISAGGQVIAHVNCCFGNGEAHARLIAAAPELLATLVDLYNSRNDSQINPEQWARCQRMITRVEGGSS